MRDNLVTFVRAGRLRRPARMRTRHPLLRQLVVRTALAVPVVLGVVTLIFLISLLSHQDPALAVLGPGSSAAARAAFDNAHGLGGNVFIRYGRYLDHLAHGNLGNALATQQPISTLMGSAIPVTVSLTLLASFLALLIGLVFGSIAAVRRNSLFDRGVTGLASLGQAMPAPWTGLLVIELFAVNLHLVPSGGYTPPSQSIGGWLQSLITPALVLAVPFGAVMARVVRGSMIEELNKDYVRTAEGLGLRRTTIVVRNVLGNAMVAPLTSFGTAMGQLFAGTVVIESLFQLPGLGMMLFNGINEADFGLVEAVGIFGGVAFVFVNLVVDVISTLLNPRERVSR